VRGDQPSKKGGENQRAICQKGMGKGRGGVGGWGGGEGFACLNKSELAKRVRSLYKINMLPKSKKGSASYTRTK
jgi:hypothetical protein